MRFVGIDLHKHSITICVVQQDRTVLQTRKFACADADRIVAFFASLGEFQAVIEATASYDLERLAASLRAAVPEFNPASEADSARASTTILNFPARRARPN